MLGGISTTLASYLAKVRGSGEPENSTLRARELSTFIREVNAFKMDHGSSSIPSQICLSLHFLITGHKLGPEFDPQIMMYRQRFELIISTEGEDSNRGSTRSRGPISHNFTPTPNQQQAYGGGYYQQMPPGGGNRQLSEKELLVKNEKAISGMV